MARVDSDEVLEIVSDDVPTTVAGEDIDLDPFINVANRYVTANLDSALLSAAQLKDIELYLAAHFAVLKYKFSTDEKAGSVSASYQNKNDLGLALTHYGQTAMTLDTTGELSRLNAQIKNGGSSQVSVSWMGEDYDEEEEDE